MNRNNGKASIILLRPIKPMSLLDVAHGNNPNVRKVQYLHYFPPDFMASLLIIHAKNEAASSLCATFERGTFD